MAGITTLSSLSVIVKSYYQKLMQERLIPEFRFYQFGIKKPLPKNEGRTVYFTRYTNLGVASYISTEGSNPSATTLSVTQVSCAIKEYGQVVEVSQILQDVAIGDVIKEAVALTVDSANDTVDQYIQKVLHREQESTPEELSAFAMSGLFK